MKCPFTEEDLTAFKEIYNARDLTLLGDAMATRLWPRNYY
jgi:hypothetical protein